MQRTSAGPGRAPRLGPRRRLWAGRRIKKLSPHARVGGCRRRPTTTGPALDADDQDLVAAEAVPAGCPVRQGLPEGFDLGRDHGLGVGGPDWWRDNGQLRRAVLQRLPQFRDVYRQRQTVETGGEGRPLVCHSR